MLLYLKSAYAIFNKEDAAAVAEQIDAIVGNYVSDTVINVEDARLDVSGLVGASFALNATPAVRFYLDGEYAVDKYIFKVGDRTISSSELVLGNDLEYGKYVDITLYAYEMISVFSYEIADTDISGEYNLISYYADAVEKGDDKLINVVAMFYNYCKSADNYRKSVVSAD